MEPNEYTDPYLLEAFDALKPHCWDIHTCDAGYVCRIFSAPEKGEELLAKAAGWSISSAIRAALRNLDAKKASASNDQ